MRCLSFNCWLLAWSFGRAHNTPAARCGVLVAPEEQHNTCLPLQLLGLPSSLAYPLFYKLASATDAAVSTEALLLWMHATAFWAAPDSLRAFRILCQASAHMGDGQHGAGRVEWAGYSHLLLTQGNGCIAVDHSLGHR